MIIPKDKSHNFQRWEFASLDTKVANQIPKADEATSAPSTIEPPAEQPPVLPTAEQVVQLYEEARQQGFEAGLIEGKAAFDENAGKALEQEASQLGQLIENFKKSLSQLDQGVADQLLKLSIEIASQVCRCSIAVQDDYLLPIIREAIAILPLHHAHLTLRLNPADAANVRLHLGEPFSQTGTQIIEDNTIAVGGCQLTAGASEVDATIETRWKRVLEAIGTEPTPWLIR
jgi:flagellar assembly protein FliH